MKKNKTSVIILAAVSLLFTAGCSTVKIKDTAGIKLYLQDQGRSEILALDIKTKDKTKKTDAYKNAESLYNRAAGLGNGWTKGIVTDVKFKKEVNVTVQDYQTSPAGLAISQFLLLDSSAPKPATGPVVKPMFSPATITLAALLAKEVIKIIDEQNKKSVADATTVIEQEFQRTSWTTFELTTSEWINTKYGTQKK